MATVNYLIAFGRKPNPGFLSTLVHLAKEEGVEIIGARMAPGPGCCNIGLRMEENEAFINALTVALMPAKWSCTVDVIEDGQFIDEVNA
jgi:hypothetical protein